ncbi:hypothetical protein SHKM778_79440 [Streptomyces sp. KM77-8]|uniref:ERAP1-like C-terminal domain-containing protein n=1 Tax=Streptomyces haneummycinicus TaxID=3074435 RepID=A0AAT9HV64_9ACTN
MLLGEDGRIDELAVLQEAAESHPELRPHRVAVGLYRRTDSGSLERYAQAETDVEGARTVVTELAGADAPELVLVNDDDLTYCKTRFDETSLAALRSGLGDLTDPLARALCWSALWNMTRDALLPAREFTALVLRFAGRESDIGVLQTLHAWAESAAVHYTARDHREQAGRRLAEGAAHELDAAGAGSGQQLAWARFFAQVAAAPADFEQLTALLDGTVTLPGLTVDQELRWAFLEPLAAHGVADEKRLDEELARDDTASGRRHHVRCSGRPPVGGGQGAVLGAGRGVGRAVQRPGGGHHLGLRAAVAAGADRAVHGEVLRGDRAGVDAAVHPDRDGRGARTVPRVPGLAGDAGRDGRLARLPRGRGSRPAPAGPGGP